MITSYLIAIAAVSIIGVIAAIVITVARPNTDNTLLIASIFGFLLPTLMALLALMKTQETHVAVNSRMDELLKITRTASRAEGVLEGSAAHVTPPTPPPPPSQQ